jgi:hypothetical protein
MSLTPPKRLFHVPTMSTVFYRDVADDVAKKGYAAVSHVWGDQQTYSATELGILGGVDWKIPLSDPNKIHRLVDAMTHYEMEYAWFDVLCMPQDKQDGINLEIPHMGDYYSGSEVTLVLCTVDYHISDDFKKWMEIVANAARLSRSFSTEEIFWMVSLGERKEPLFDVSKEIWFTRVWTAQEAIMSKKVILVCTEEYFNLTSLLHLVIYMSHNMYLIRDLFKDTRLHDLSTGMYLYNSGSHDVVGALQTVGKRECYKQQDKFYGVLGILGYKDFVVDYNISMEDLNKNIVRHAYSKGDISWISVYGTINKGFLQPMHKQSVRVGTSWKEIGRHMRFEGDSLYVPSKSFATVIRSEKCNLGTADKKFTKWIVLTMVSWGYTLNDAIVIITAFEKYPKIVYEMIDGILRLIVVDADPQEKREYMRKRFPAENAIDNSLAAERAVVMLCIRVRPSWRWS